MIEKEANTQERYESFEAISFAMSHSVFFIVGNETKC